MARAEQYDVETVIQAIHRGHTAMGAAAILGCHANTVVNYAKKYKTVANALRMERRAMRDLAELSLRQRIVLGEGWAVMGVFKLFDEDGNAIPQNKIELNVRTQDVSQLTDDELEAIATAKSGG